MGVVMKPYANRWLLQVVCLLGCWGSAAANSPLESNRAFLKKYCFECHGPEEQKGEYRFDTLGTDLADLHTLET